MTARRQPALPRIRIHLVNWHLADAPHALVDVVRADGSVHDGPEFATWREAMDYADAAVMTARRRRGAVEGVPGLPS